MLTKFVVCSLMAVILVFIFTILDMQPTIPEFAVTGLLLVLFYDLGYKEI